MRRTRLSQASIGVATTPVCIAVLFALLRAFVIYPAESYAQEGFALFKGMGCMECHFTDSREVKVGPGLKGLFQREKLPVSGRKVTEENVRRQLETPYNQMPSFAYRLTEEQKEELIAYLKTL